MERYQQELEGATENTTWYQGMGWYKQWRYGNRAGASYGPSFDDGPEMVLLPVPEWWNQIVYVFSRRPKEDPTGEIEVLRLSRKDIVLTATNKDGGAHVDQKLTPAYEMLAADGAVGSFIWESDGVKQEFPITKAHLVALRQIGHEVLRSLSGNWSPVEHVMQEFEPLGGNPPRATLFMRCGTLSGPGSPGSEGWRELNEEVTPIDTEIGIYSFTCPYCQGRTVWDPRELGPPAPR